MVVLATGSKDARPSVRPPINMSYKMLGDVSEAVISETLDKVSVLTTFAQSGLVSV